MLSMIRGLCLAQLLVESEALSPAQLVQLTSSEWGPHVLISEAVVRKTLIELASEGLVRQSKLVGQPGRPQIKYALTKTGKNQFIRERKLVARLFKFKGLRSLKSGSVPEAVEPAPPPPPPPPIEEVHDDTVDDQTYHGEFDDE